MKLRDENGKLTEEGRRHFKANGGGNLRAPVANFDQADFEGKKRWIAFAHKYAGADQIPALLSGDGKNATPFALMFGQWGEQVPKSIADVKAIAAKAQTRAAALSLGTGGLIHAGVEFAQESEEIDAFLADDIEVKPIYELFCENGDVALLEGAEATADAEATPTLIEKTILRTGTWRLRPSAAGPLRKPLKIFRDKAPKGHISLSELKKNFEANAIDHVTVPTRHTDQPQENTGYVRKLSIKDNEDGSSELVAGIEFTEPDILGKVQRKTIPNVSAGVLFDFVHKQSAKKFGQVLAHVCLTGKPWINGMTPFEDSVMASEEFEADEVVSLEFDTNADPDLSLAPTTNNVWDSSPARFSDEQWKRSCLLHVREGTDKSCFRMPIREPEGAINVNALNAAVRELEKSDTNLSDDQKGVARRKLITAFSAAGEDLPPSLSLDDPKVDQPAKGSVVWKAEEGSGWIRAKISDELRKLRAVKRALGQDYDAIPYYSVADVAGDKALITSGYGAEQEAWVATFTITDGDLKLAGEDEWVAARSEWVAASQQYHNQSLPSVPAPGQPPRRGTPTPPKSEGTALEQAQQARDLRLSQGQPANSNKTNGGSMKLTVDELLARGVSLSEDEIKDMRAEEARIKADAEELETRREKDRETDVSAKLSELQGKDIDATPGLKKTIRDILLSDDGGTALEFSEWTEPEEGKGDPARIGKAVGLSATEIVDKIIEALPLTKEGKLAFSQQVHKVPGDVKPDEKNPDDPEGKYSDEGAAERAIALEQELDAPWARKPEPAAAGANGGS